MDKYYFIKPEIILLTKDIIVTRILGGQNGYRIIDETVMRKCDEFYCFTAEKKFSIEYEENNNSDIRIW